MLGRTRTWFRGLRDKFSSDSSRTRAADERNHILSSVRVVLRGVADTLDGVPAPGLQGAIKGVLFILDNFDRASQNLTDFQLFAKALATYEDLFKPYKSQDIPAALMRAINALNTEIDESCKVIEQMAEHCRARRVWESADDAGVFTRQVRVINQALHRFQVATLTDTSVTINESLEINQRLHLDRLPIERSAFFNSADHDRVSSCCLDNTRMDIRKRIMDWMLDESTPPIFWLQGIPGSGKSTIAQSIAEVCHEQGHLAGHFFFCRKLLGEYAGSKLFSTIASQLCSFDTRLYPILSEALQIKPALRRPDLQGHFTSLIAEPLAALNKAEPGLSFPMLVVIDALDECPEIEDALTILSLLFNHPLRSETRPFLKFLITSRRERDICEAFNAVEDKEKIFTQHNLDEDNAQDDIELYLRLGLEEVYKSRPECFRSRTTPWPEPEALATLVEKSKGLFIQASTILKFVGDQRQHPNKQLRLVLDAMADERAQATMYGGLDGLYKQILSRDPNPQRVRMIVGAIVLSADPLSIPELEKRLKLDEGESYCSLQWLHPVLSIPSNDDDPIHPIHPTLRDFLTSKPRSGEYFVDPEEHCNAYGLRM